MNKINNNKMKHKIIYKNNKNQIKFYLLVVEIQNNNKKMQK